MIGGEREHNLSRHGIRKKYRRKYEAEQRTSAFLIGLLVGAAIAMVWEAVRR